MRVSKIVKSYIEEEVTKKLKEKYMDEAKEAQCQRKTQQNIMEKAREAAEKAWLEIVLAEVPRYDFLTFRKCNNPHISMGSIEITDRIYINHVQNWERRMHNEKDEIVKNILVKLELGGTKEDLDKMLNDL